MAVRVLDDFVSHALRGFNGEPRMPTRTTAAVVHI
jgi:hypothetical protein